MTEQNNLPAGDFSSWLHHTRHALVAEDGTKVDCGTCIACCSSSQFVHIRPDETGTLDRIDHNLLVAAPLLPKGHVLMGYDSKGFCPMMRNGMCSIYEIRPLTCRTYDCRIFTAAGILSGKPLIDQRAGQWKFSYPTERDRNEHLAVQAAARFIREQAVHFPGGRVPTDPGQLAVLAIKSYDVLLEHEGPEDRPPVETANAIVEACRRFDTGRRESR